MPRDPQQIGTRALRRHDVDEQAVATRYLAGESSIRIAMALGCSVNAVFARLKAAGIPSRRSGTPGLFREASPRWGGDAISYWGLHLRVKKLRGTPSRCEVCGMDDPSKRYEWANVTGRYEDPSDYRRMCVSCHRRYDDKGMGRGASRRAAPVTRSES